MKIRKIEKNIPIPEPGRNGPSSRFPFENMEPGDSFLVETKDHKKMKQIQNLAYKCGPRYRMKFATRKVDGGMRVWRVK
jgi:hypothetical protein